MEVAGHHAKKFVNFGLCLQIFGFHVEIWSLAENIVVFLSQRGLFSYLSSPPSFLALFVCVFLRSSNGVSFVELFHGQFVALEVISAWSS